MFFGNGHDMFGMHGLGWIFGLVLVAALAFVLFGRSCGWRRYSRETPHEILRRRLASGEIDVAQYEQRKALLDRDRGDKT